MASKKQKFIFLITQIFIIFTNFYDKEIFFIIYRFLKTFFKIFEGFLT